MPGIQIDWAALEGAFESHAPEIRRYLNTRTGAVFTVQDGAAKDAQTTESSIAGDAADLLLIDAIPSREQYRMMERFIDTVTNTILKERLQDAIVGKGAFRRFKDVVGRFPEERKRWFGFRDVLLHLHILDWLKQAGIVVTEMPAWSLELPVTPAAHSTGVVTASEVLAADTSQEAVDERAEMQDLRAYLLSWARAHGEEYRYLFGPVAFERLAQDVAREFTVFRRRPGRPADGAAHQPLAGSLGIFGPDAADGQPHGDEVNTETPSDGPRPPAQPHETP